MSARLPVPLARLLAEVGEMLTDVQTSLFRMARDEQERRTLRDPSSYNEMIEYRRDARGSLRRRGVVPGSAKRASRTTALRRSGVSRWLSARRKQTPASAVGGWRWAMPCGRRRTGTSAALAVYGRFART